ncbi:hypothetical protein NIES2111_64040 (plasmid) [Nostoc sp. NIES-2111]|nr:hypothetical protein NIES2111_64040 [Nostoc sp. NIES-2111]
MSIENVSPKMQKRFNILDKLSDGEYIKPIKPVGNSLCFAINKTSKYNSASPELKKELEHSMFSWYAFFLAPFAFTQTKLARDYFVFISIIFAIYCLLQLPTYISTGISAGVRLAMSQAFTFSRYYQYKTYGKCPHNRNVFSTICLGLIGYFLALIPGIIITMLFYPNTIK